MKVFKGKSNSKKNTMANKTHNKQHHQKKAKSPERQHQQKRPKSPQRTATDRNKPGSGRQTGDSGGFNLDPVQFAVGAAVGGFGGYMDSQYIEPFGLVFGGTLAVLQILDFSAVIKLPWNSETASRSDDLLEDVVSFAGSNVGAATGFAAGYLMGYNVLDWLESAGAAEEDSGGGGESSSSSSSE